MRLSCVVLALVAAMVISSGCSQDKDVFDDPLGAQKYENFAPPTAQVVDEGTGPLHYTPQTKGTLYLVDLDDMQMVKDQRKPRVVMTGNPLPGPEITFDPSTGMVSRPGKKGIKLNSVKAGHRHQLLWQEFKK
jgi:hypothetical protein